MDEEYTVTRFMLADQEAKDLVKDGGRPKSDMCQSWEGNEEALGRGQNRSRVVAPEE